MSLRRSRCRKFSLRCLQIPHSFRLARFTFMISSNRSFPRIFGLAAMIAVGAGQTFAQSAPAEPTDSKWWIIGFVVVAGGFAMAVYFWRKATAAAANKPQYNYGSRYGNYYSNTHQSYELTGLDADKELEWLRKAKRPNSSKGTGSKISYGPKTPDTLPAAAPASTQTSVPNPDAKEFQEKMRRLQYSQLPINSFMELRPPRGYDPLPEADDPSLLNAIEQANEEYEDDESVRDLAVRVLTAFRTKNSVEALSQLALYDLSSNLRARAVGVLTDFDHESVFETILLACADPTREVRAAAARGLFRLSFDRSDAWRRIIETDDEFRMSHAVRAAIESGIVVKAFDRLVHDDLKIAYEAFVLVSLLIKSGNTREVFDAIRNHRDERVRLALLHTLRMHKDARTLTELYELQKDSSLTGDISGRIHDTILSMQHVAA